MAKKIKIWQNCIFTKDDEGALTLVGKAKEALTSFDKLGIEVTISLKDISKSEAEEFLSKHNVPYKDLYEAKVTEEYDLIVTDNTTCRFGSWEWTAEDVVRRLYDKQENNKISEQKQMDNSLQRIIKLTKERNKEQNFPSM